MTALLQHLEELLIEFLVRANASKGTVGDSIEKWEIGGRIFASGSFSARGLVTG